MTMKKNITVSKFRYRHVDKQNKRPVGLRLRMVTPSAQLDFPVYRPNGNSLKLSDAQYQNLTDEHYMIIENMKGFIKSAAFDLVNQNQTINKKSIEKRMLALRARHFSSVLNGYFEREIISDDPIILDELLENVNVEDGVMAEDLSDIVAHEQVKYDEKKWQEKISKEIYVRNSLERTRKQYKYLPWDYSNLILHIGYLFTFDKDNGKPKIHSINRSLINNLYDYIIHTNAPNDISKFDDQYCRNFIKHMVKNGVIKKSLGKTSFELVSGAYDYFFNENPHEPLSYATFKDKIKAINSYIENFNELGVKIAVNKKYTADSFIDTREVNTDKSTKIDHTLTPNEVLQLIGTEFDDVGLERAKEMLIILIFCGGLRGIANFDVIIHKDQDYLDVYHHKVHDRCDIPIFDELRPILEKHDYEFPEFLEQDEFLFNIRSIANNLGWTRKVKTLNTDINRKKGDPYYHYRHLNVVIDQTFARKTFVNYARLVYGMSSEEIIEYTLHSSVDILSHYKGKMTIEEKKKKIRSKNEVVK
jgi:hypothetical protein